MAEARVDEVRSLARLAFGELGGAASGLYGFHRAIAGRAFGASGPGALPARMIHDAIASRAYAGVGAAFRLVGAVADAGLGRRQVGDGRSLSSTPRGALVVGALNGLVGDELERTGSDLHAPLSVRVEGRPVALEPESVAAAFPDATGLLVVFVHGLMESEFAWRIGAGPDGDTYGTRLRRELGYTPVELRYNTGRHISDNGLDLADALEDLVAAWPQPVERIALVGHSMGGLVSRSACHQGFERGDPWVSRVRHVVSLGTPHMGAPLAQGVHWASATLHALPETRPIASVLRRRSAGIRDLRQGSLVDADWRDRDPDALKAVACEEVPLLEGATHCFVAATVTGNPRHPVARLIGDLLVLEDSASGRSRSRRIPFEAEYGAVLGGTNHIALLNHPAVYARLRDWLTPL
jgi:pimeloyl-ACP methyl ester carboxylesterase